MVADVQRTCRQEAAQLCMPTCSHMPPDSSHMATVASKLAVASALPVGLQATLRMVRVWHWSRMALQYHCPASLLLLPPLLAEVLPARRLDQILTVLSPLQLASMSPGENNSGRGEWRVATTPPCAAANVPSTFLQLKLIYLCTDAV